MMVPCRHCGAPFTRRYGQRWHCSEACRFWSKVDRSGGSDACWPWTASRERDWGYGNYTRVVDGRNVAQNAHRFAYELAKGTAPDGLFVCHRCDNPPCCNPAHLFLGTPTENARDKIAKGRSGNPTGESCHNAKLTAELVLEIRARYRDTDLGVDALAASHGVRPWVVFQIVKGRSWKSVTGGEPVVPARPKPRAPRRSTGAA